MLVADIGTSHDELFAKGIWTKSMINTYMRCPVQFEQRYIYGRKEPPGWAMCVGIVADRLVQVWGERVMRRGHLSLPEGDLSSMEVRDLLSTYWDQEIGQRGIVPDEREPHKTKDAKLQSLTRCFEDWRICVPQWGLGQVEAVQPFYGADGSMELDGVPIAGHPDLVFEQAAADLKCVKQTSMYRKGGLYGSLMDYVFQSLLTGKKNSSLLVMIHDFKTSAQTRVEHKPERIRQPVIDMTSEIVQRVDMAVRRGDFPPFNKVGSYPCMAKWCGFWGICPVTKHVN